ncbi:MAG: radical SAM protein [Candidatus Aminicenantes bacterium]|nr:radical SAM protein [Candidatus Aminicenantes bacterium]
MYDFPPFRPPNEARSALLRITRGCPWNRCAFCAMYKSLSFEQKSLEEIKDDVRTARLIYGKVETIFLGDSDNLIHKDLPEIVVFIRKTFPEAKRITSYTRAKTILRDTLEFLVATRNAGLNRLHIGLESGDPVVLERLCKGASPGQMIRAGQKAKQAGFEVSFYVINGAGGKDRWDSHAKESARVLNQAHPDFIRLRTLTIQKGTPLDEKLAKGEFQPTPPLERLKEVELFIQSLDLKNCYLASDHITNYLWSGSSIIYQGVSGRIPEDKQSMLETVQQAIQYVGSTSLPIRDSNQLYREGFISAL